MIEAVDSLRIYGFFVNINLKYQLSYKYYKALALSYSKFYFVMFSGITGMAPFWVHTYALTSTASL